MSAEEAERLLHRLAAGDTEHELCTGEGQLALRGAVRAYGLSMTEAGREWPPLPNEDGAIIEATSLDAGVLVAYAGGWLEPSDFQEPARGRLLGTDLLQSRELRMVRAIAPRACEETARWHAAATHFAIESLAYERTRDPERRARRRERVEQAREAMELAREAVAARAVETVRLAR